MGDIVPTVACVPAVDARNAFESYGPLRMSFGVPAAFDNIPNYVQEPRMIIVAGRIYTRSGQRDLFIERSLDAARAARQTAGCRDFVVAADPLEPDRVNVHEEWDTLAGLHAFRESGPDSGIAELIASADVVEYEAHPLDT